MAVSPYNNGDLGGGGSSSWSGTPGGGAMPEGIGPTHGFNDPMAMKVSPQPLGPPSMPRTDKAVSSLIPPKLELSNG